MGASARPQPAPAPKPLDAWFFEAAGDGMHLPPPSRLVASQRLNRWLKRGGLSLGMRRVGPVCGSGLQGGCAPAGHAAGSCNEAHEWAQERITRPTAWAHMYAHPAVKRQDMVGRSCQNTDRTSRMFGPEHQQSTATLTSDFSTTTNPIEMIQKPMCSKLSLVSYEPSSLVNIFKS